MNEPSTSANDLTSGQKKALRGMGHHLEPVVYVGKEGLSPAMLQSLEAALKAHELIKVKIGQNCPLERNTAGRELAIAAEATLVQVIGRMALLYRPNPDLPETKKVHLPNHQTPRS
jgi:RNA-binding protein